MHEPFGSTHPRHLCTFPTILRKAHEGQMFALLRVHLDLSMFRCSALRLRTACRGDMLQSLVLVVILVASTVQHFAEGSTKLLNPARSPSSLFTRITYPVSEIPSQCTNTQYTWLSNSQGQSACVVAKAVAETCANSVQDSTQPLSGSSCPCSTVLYSLIYACALCTDMEKLQMDFDVWINSMDCEGSLDEEYPVGLIPSGVDIAPWAFLPLTADDEFDVAQASKEVANQATTVSPDPRAVISTNPVSSTAVLSESDVRTAISSRSPATASTGSSKAPASRTPGSPVNTKDAAANQLGKHQRRYRYLPL
ncbi:hypothetical protein GY45DRAFT_1055027 [Cubamyces sp. BRFM 1775]|nr:hypothetical protein GY45DRAFT_1055027 [Cubamyces sp. BRFM 1775]